MLDKKSGRIYLMLYGICTALLVSSIFFNTVNTLLPNFASLQLSASRLYTDAFMVGAENATILNAAILGMLALASLLLARVKPTGFTVACVFMIIGAGFAGMTVLSVPPIIFGTWLYAKLKKERYQKYSHEALLAFALSPVINQVAFGQARAFGSVGQYILALLVGIFIGFVVAPLAYTVGHKTRIYRMQYELCALGIVSMVFYAGYKTIVIDRTFIEDFAVLESVVSEGSNLWLIFIVLFLAFIGLAFALHKDAKNIYIKEMKTQVGKDYIEVFSISSILINIALVGLITLLYFACIGVSFHGISICVLMLSLGLACLRLNPLHIPVVLIGLLLSAYTGISDLHEPVMLFGYAFSLGLTAMVPHSNVYVAIFAGILFNYLNIFSQSLFAGLNLYGSGAAMGFSIFISNTLYRAFILKETTEINE